MLWGSLARVYEVEVLHTDSIVHAGHTKHSRRECNKRTPNKVIEKNDIILLYECSPASERAIDGAAAKNAKIRGVIESKETGRLKMMMMSAREMLWRRSVFANYRAEHTELAAESSLLFGLRADVEYAARSAWRVEFSRPFSALGEGEEERRRSAESERERTNEQLSERISPSSRLAKADEKPSSSRLSN
jgi:hypothetical protein